MGSDYLPGAILRGSMEAVGAMPYCDAMSIFVLEIQETRRDSDQSQDSRSSSDGDEDGDRAPLARVEIEGFHAILPPPGLTLDTDELDARPPPSVYEVEQANQNTSNQQWKETHQRKQPRQPSGRSRQRERRRQNKAALLLNE